MNVTPDAAHQPDAEYFQALREAQKALQAGHRLAARRLAEQAAALQPEREDSWLLLAALASPRASVEYLKRALEINPQSARARQGMHWAAERLRREQPPAPPQPRPVIAALAP